MAEPVGSALFAAALGFEDVAVDVEKVESLARLLSTAQVLDERESLAFYGLADLLSAVRDKVKGLEDKFTALSAEHRKAA